MPKSKRNKLVTLSKTKKKTKQWKEGLIATVQTYIDTFPNIYVFQYFNMRNDKLKELREQLLDSSKFCLGSTKVMKVALGHNPDQEQRPNLALLAECIRGNVGLFFTRLPRDKVEELFASYMEEDFARAGTSARDTFELAEGLLEGPTGPVAHTQEPWLREQGLPVRLNRGVVEMLADYTVCTAGETLTSHQAALLRFFGERTAVFRMRLLASWHEEGHEFRSSAVQNDGESNTDYDLQAPVDDGD